MSPFVVRRIVQTPAERVWAVLSDFSSHGRWVPLTRIRSDPGQPRVGWSFTAITGVGPGVLRDRMTVELWEPPNRARPQRAARFRITKHGPVLRGWVNVQVTPVSGTLGARTTEVIWTESLRLRLPFLGALLAPVLAPISKSAYEVVIDRMLAAAAKAPQ
ncbi:MAG: SRPBCC family protein [Austwickia sp.]|nr:SRPBCC family protein [Austwickia sp.]MBK8435992.1 SRPBCC family protein [Austwickia sp.]MBK9101671.1 SRPBCC family protein [Austwickia sp.]